MAREQFQVIADYLAIPEDERDRLLYPKRAIAVACPIHRDDGKTSVFMGFARYGFRAEAARIFEGLFSACTYIDLRRLPELVCGFPRRRSQGPTFYPVACAPQAWSAATPLSLVQSCLGLGFDPASATVFFDRPMLPHFLEEVVLRGLSIGTSRIDVALRGRGSDVAMTVLSRTGEIRATMTS
ncbi:MAG: hypothetical protein J0H14_20955, partial [Alphaproteobacteria bacterium]|nr:hypothetical protein [Alphaproteobacteria bacterium]